MNWAWIVPVLNILKSIKWYWFVIIFLLLVILIQRECTPRQHIIETTTHKTDTVYQTDSISYPVEVYKPYPVYKDTGSTKWKYRDVDTLAILKDYFTAYFYKDTILNDSNGIVVISDVLYRNRIKSRKKDVRLTPTTIYITRVKMVDRNTKVFMGFGVGYGWKYNNPSFTVNVMLINKKDNAYTVAYDVLNNSANLTIYWKLHFRRRK